MALTNVCLLLLIGGALKEVIILHYFIWDVKVPNNKLDMLISSTLQIHMQLRLHTGMLIFYNLHMHVQHYCKHIAVK